jgi:thiosulfate/3-mercaptopyruvate sulfurtransferase
MAVHNWIGVLVKMRGLLSVLVFSAVLPLQAQRNPGMLVSTEWLAGHLGDASLVILHVGSQEDYGSGHIAGARLVRLADISATGDKGLRLELPSPEALGTAFGQLGVAEASRIVVYPAADSVQSATRVWFTLDYLGLGERTSLLDGGLSVWKAESRPTTTEVPTVRSGSFISKPAAGRVANAEWVRAHLNDPKVLLVDARLPEFYSGGNAGGMPRAGHIPGARNVPFSSLLGQGGKLKSAAALREALSGSGGTEPGTLVSYCHIGQQATLVYFAARYLGYDARLYDGSFQDWSTRSELPVQSQP